jgi:hypothetical protein
MIDGKASRKVSQKVRSGGWVNKTWRSKNSTAANEPWKRGRQVSKCANGKEWYRTLSDEEERILWNDNSHPRRTPAPSSFHSKTTSFNPRYFRFSTIHPRIK